MHMVIASLGFPAWLRVTHFINLLFIGLLIRSGLQMTGAAIAPARGVETELGYKMVKYLRSIEFVKDYSHLGDGQGGYREDVQYYGKGAEI